MSERPALSAERYVRFVGLVMPSLLTASQLPVVLTWMTDKSTTLHPRSPLVAQTVHLGL